MTPMLVKILISLAILLGGHLLSAGLRRITRRIGEQHDLSHGRVFRMSVIINVICLVLGLVLLALVWGLSGSGVMVFTTSLAALLGVALFASWSMLSNTTASVILFFTAPYKVGDRIRVLDGDNTITGLVRHMGLVFLSLEDPEGHLYTLPNNLLMQKTVIRLYGDTLPVDRKHCQ